MDDDADNSAKASMRPRAVLLGIAIGLVGAPAADGIERLPGNADVDSGCPGRACRPPSVCHRSPVARSPRRWRSPPPLQGPRLAFTDSAGEAQALADWRGRVVLLNLWATWCVPCRKEMPTLDALEATLGGKGFDVVAVNIDTRDPEKPRAFLSDAGLRHLAYYADPTAKTFQELKLRRPGVRHAHHLDRPQGCELASLAGPADWVSEDALKLIKAALPS